MNTQFPHNFRLITEIPAARWYFYAKIFCFSFITTFLLVVIMVKGYQIFAGIQTLQAASHKHEELMHEQSYWQDVVNRHPGYRDAEFKLAVLSYELGETTKAKQYLRDVLTIDPNFSEGKAFAQQIGL